MNTTKLTATTLTVVALMSTLALTGCAVRDANAVPPGTTFSATPTPAAPTVAATIPYTMQNGTIVQLDKNAPTPDAVKADVIAKYHDVFGSPTAPVDQALKEASISLGKTIILVSQGLTSSNDPNDDKMYIKWAVGNTGGKCIPVDTEAEALACAQAFVNGSYGGDCKYTILDVH